MKKVTQESIEQMTPIQRLTAVLVLALTASTDERAAEAGELADEYARGLSESEIDVAKAAALAEVDAAKAAA